MKFLITFAFFILVASAVNAEDPKEPDEEHNKIITECRKHFKVTDEEYLKLRHDELPNPDENMQCLANCFMEKVGILKDGKFQPEGANMMFTKTVGAEKSKGIVATCGGESGQKKCETAYKLHKCFVANKGY